LPGSDPVPSTVDVCPYLGIREDAQTCLAYPAEWNLCHRARPPAAVRLDHQRECCLSPVYTCCPVFSSEADAPLPQQFRGSRRRSRWKWAFLAALLLLTLALWAAWGAQAGVAFFLPGANPVATLHSSIGSFASPLPLASATPLALAATRTPFPATFSPPAPRPSATGTPTAVMVCGHSLETRLEIDGRALVLHQVSRGESIAVLATNYETSLAALQAVNYFLPSPLWAELVIVIPVGELEGQGLPVLEPYQIPGAGMSLADLAGQFSLTPGELARANALHPDCLLVSGWVLVPHPAQRNP
jgi:hypothetical protein